MGARSTPLLRGMLTTGLIGFGGGSALIPIIEREVVEKRDLLTPEMYTRHVVVANMTPGALPVKLAAFAGHATRGAGLALLAALTVAAPGTLATLGLLAASDALGPGATQVIRHASVGIAAFIIVLLVGYILTVHRRAGRHRGAFVVITLLSALATGADSILRVIGTLAGRPIEFDLPSLSAVQLILLSLLLIGVYSLWQRGRHPGRDTSVALPHVRADRTDGRVRSQAGRAWMTTLVFVAVALAGVGLFAIVGGADGARLGGLLGASAASSFGGGEAYVGIAEGFFVRQGHIGRDEFFTQLVPIANALPGPILLKVGAGIGFISGAATGGASAWLLGIAGMLVTLGMTCAIATPVLAAFESLRHVPFVVNVARFILPVICGLLIHVSASMLDVSAEVAADAGLSGQAVLWVSLAAIAGMTVLHVRRMVPDLAMLLVCGAVSLAVLGW
nr:hypothetical protein [Actinomycetales bacterium]